MLRKALFLSPLFLLLFCAQKSFAKKVHIKTYKCDSTYTAPVMLGEMVVPEEKEQDFTKAACTVMQVLYSDTFRHALADYIAQYASKGRAVAAWQDWQSADKVIAALKEKIKGMEVETIGGPAAWAKLKMNGNIIDESAKEGPIKLIEPGLKGHDYVTIAGAIIHAAAHRAGMQHPSFDTNFPSSLCEPPYVLGSLMVKIIQGDDWKWTDDNCAHLK